MDCNCRFFPSCWSRCTYDPTNKFVKHFNWQNYKLSENQPFDVNFNTKETQILKPGISWQSQRHKIQFLDKIASFWHNRSLRGALPNCKGNRERFQQYIQLDNLCGVTSLVSVLFRYLGLAFWWKLENPSTRGKRAEGEAVLGRVSEQRVGDNGGGERWCLW